MKVKIKPVLFVAGTILVGLVGLAQVRSTEILWLDFDMKSIPEPKERPSGYYDYFFKGQLIEEAKLYLDLPRWTRLAAGRAKQAANVNALDEAPDSSWYTNRQRFHRMGTTELQRGPNTGNPPDFTTLVVTKTKTGGVTPGMMVKDATGQAYLVKFDGADYPNLQSGAEVISTKIMYAAGYNVPENYVAYIDPDSVTIGDRVEVTDTNTGQLRPLTKTDIDAMLRKAAQAEDGRFRVLASKILKGKPKGSFPQVGLRGDDPNDLIPHEHRRELRAMRVIASWINNWDLKEAQSLDMYVEENGRKFLRHYLLDFGSSLGADDQPKTYYHGHEYGLDWRSIGKEIVSLGLHESANEKSARIISPEIGNFTSAGFDPGKWKPTFPSVMFDNMTDDDAFWATRVILSFTENDLRSIIQTAEYSNPRTNKYILKTLLERKQMLARYWLGRVDALSDFSVRRASTGIVLSFRDLMVDNQFASADSTEYAYQVTGTHYKSAKRIVNRPEIRIEREIVGGALEQEPAGSLVEISIWTKRQGFTSDPVKVYFGGIPDGDSYSVRRVSRG